MNYLHYILALVALLALVPTVTYLLPGHPAHFLPALTVALALLVWFLPTTLDAGLSLVVPATLLIRYMPIDPVPTERLNYKPLIGSCKALAGKVKSAAATATKIRIVRAEKPAGDPEPHPAVAAWLARGAQGVVPAKDTASPTADAADDDDVPDLEPPAQQTQIRKFYNSLLD